MISSIPKYWGSITSKSQISLAWSALDTTYKIHTFQGQEQPKTGPWMLIEPQCPVSSCLAYSSAEQKSVLKEFDYPCRRIKNTNMTTNKPYIDPRELSALSSAIGNSGM